MDAIQVTLCFVWVCKLRCYHTKRFLMNEEKLIQIQYYHSHWNNLHQILISHHIWMWFRSHCVSYEMVTCVFTTTKYGLYTTNNEKNYWKYIEYTEAQCRFDSGFTPHMNVMRKAIRNPIWPYILKRFRFIPIGFCAWLPNKCRLMRTIILNSVLPFTLKHKLDWR